MGWFSSKGKTFSKALGPRRYLLLSLAIGIAGLVTVLLNFWESFTKVEINMSGLMAYVPLAIGIVIALVLVFLWLLEYATRLRLELELLTDLEGALDTLSTYFDEGNNEIFNASIETQIEYGAWKEKWGVWCLKVENHLEEHFGLRERNMFKNLVIVFTPDFPGINDDHAFDRRQVAQQLETMRETIIRYSDRVQKWRAVNT